MKPGTWLLFSRKFILYYFLILICMIFTLPINALDIPLNDLLVLSQFHCFNENNICTSRLEYCNSFAKECRPCTADICAKRGGDDFPLQCNLNCSIAQAQLAASKAADKLRELNKSNSDMKAVNTALKISVSDLKKQNHELNGTFQETKDSLDTSEAKLLLSKEEVDKEKDYSRRTVTGLSAGLGCSFLLVVALIIYRTKKCRKSTIKKDCCVTTDEERGLCEQEENTSRKRYFEEKMKGTCETNEDKQKTIATTQDKRFDSSRVNFVLQSDPATTVTKDKGFDLTESKLDKDTCSKEVIQTDLDSGPLKALPLDFNTFDEENCF